jgi:hypothetical protein
MPRRCILSDIFHCWGAVRFVSVEATHSLLKHCTCFASTFLSFSLSLKFFLHQSCFQRPSVLILTFLLLVSNVPPFCSQLPSALFPMSLRFVPSMLSSYKMNVKIFTEILFFKASSSYLCSVGTHPYPSPYTAYTLPIFSSLLLLCSSMVRVYFEYSSSVYLVSYTYSFHT